MARPGSAWWLMRHELRMHMINLFVPATSLTRKPSAKTIGVWAGLLIGMHALAFFLLREVHGLNGAPPPFVLIAISALLVLLFTFMLSSAIKGSVEALYERGDLDLLLSSPIASRSILAVRLAAIVASTALLFLFFVAPFANAGLVLGHFGLLTLYPVVISMAAIAASLSMLLTLALVRVLGVRRTRVAAQMIGAIIGALIFIISQLANTPLREPIIKALMQLAPLLEPGRLLAPDSLFWQPAHAVLGSPLPALALAAIGAAAFALVLHLTHRFFVDGTQQIAGAGRAPGPPAAPQRHRFGRSLTHTVLVKEWRMILRDPQLISQVLLQLLYLLPLCGVLLTNNHAPLASIGAGLSFVCSSLTGSLAWIIIAAEDAPDLLQAAPCGKRALMRAKLLAVIGPTLALVALPLLWTAVRAPLAALLMAVPVVLATGAAALIAMWCARPGSRGDFKTRAKGNGVSTALDLLSTMSWAGSAYLLNYLLSGLVAHQALQRYAMLGLGGTLLVALLTLAAAWRWRYRAPHESVASAQALAQPLAEAPKGERTAPPDPNDSARPAQ